MASAFRLWLTKATQQLSLFSPSRGTRKHSSKLVPEKRTVRRKGRAHTQTFYVDPTQKQPRTPAKRPKLEQDTPPLVELLEQLKRESKSEAKPKTRRSEKKSTEVTRDTPAQPMLFDALSTAFEEATAHKEDVPEKEPEEGSVAKPNPPQRSERKPKQVTVTPELKAAGIAKREAEAKARAEALDYTKSFDETLDSIPAFGFELLSKSTPGQRKAANQEAIALADKLYNEKRPPTAAERAKLAAYTGDGGVTGDINAHYTPTKLAASMWRLLARAGFDGGRVLEPSMGAGVFVETAPANAQMTGVEYSTTTSKVASLLHPQVALHEGTPFENYNITSDDEKFDAIIANPPYGVRGDTAFVDKPEVKQAERYFIETSLDRLKDGGAAAFLINGGPLEQESARAFRAKLLARAEVLGVYQLPSSTFKESGSGVPPAILLLRKRPQAVGDTLARLVEKRGEEVLEHIGQSDQAFLDGTLLSDPENIIGTWTGETTFKGYKDIKGELDAKALTRLAERKLRSQPSGIRNAEHLRETLKDAGYDEDEIESAAAYAYNRRYPIPEGTIHPSGKYILKNSRWHSLNEADPIVSQAAELAQEVRTFLKQRETSPEDAERSRRALAERVQAWMDEHGDPSKHAGIQKALKNQHGLAHFTAAVENGQLAGFLANAVQAEERADPNDPNAIARALLRDNKLTIQNLARQWVTNPEDGTPATEEEALAFLRENYALTLDRTWQSKDAFYWGSVRRNVDKLMDAAKDAEQRGNPNLAEIYRAQAEEFRARQARRSLEEITVSARDKWVPKEAIAAFVGEVLDTRHQYEVEEEEGVLYLNKKSGYGPTPDVIDDFKRYLNHSTRVDSVRKQENKTKEEIDAERKANLERAKEMEILFEDQFKNWLAQSDHREAVQDAYNNTFNDYLMPDEPDDSPLDIPGYKGPAPHPFQNQAIRHAIDAGSSIMALDVGLGKALSADTPVMTPTGQRAIGHLRVGDEVIGSSGQSVKVIGVYPQGVRKAYQVTFSDGVTTTCDEEHLWAVRTATQKHRGKDYRVLSLAQIMEEGILDRRKQKSYRHFIPTVKPVAFRGCPLPVDPYLLGLLLGNANWSCGFINFSSGDQELIDEVRQRVPEGIKLTPSTSSSCDYRLAATQQLRTINGRLAPSNPLIAQIKHLGLLGTKSATKFIPQTYKFASIEDRQALLQGILDTDGHARKDNNIEYCTASQQLAQDVAFIIQSLGGTARINEKVVGNTTYYRMSVILPANVQPFRLERKAAAYHPRVKYQPTRAITQIEEDGTRDMVCIAVDAPDQLFVAEHFVVTHNTYTGSALLAKLQSMGKAKRPLITVPKSLMPNWRKSLEKAVPDKKVLVIGESYDEKAGKWKDDNFKDVARKLVQITTGEYDAVLISRDWFQAIPLKGETITRMVTSDYEMKRLEQLRKEDGPEAYKGQRRRKGKSARDIAKERAAAVQKAARKLFRHQVSPLFFEDLGIDEIIADEAHSNKNLHASPTVFGKSPKFMGGSAESKRAQDFQWKSKLVREATGGEGIHLLTATPTKNSPLEVFNMLKHTTDVFERLGVPGTEDFVSRYCDINSMFVPTPDGQLDVSPAVTGFKNLKELRSIMGRYVFRRTAEQVGLKLPERNDIEDLYDMDEEVQLTYQALAAEAKEAAGKRDADGDEHLFSYFDKMRKLTLDPALYDARFSGTPNPRFTRAADIAKKAIDEGGKTVMFMDMGKLGSEGEDGDADTSSYERLVNQLVETGIPRDQIALVTADTAKTSAERGEIEERFNKGELKVVIGSTGVIGEGFSFQKGTTDMVHLDTPWDPGTYWQRLGRVVRQGNPLDEVRNHVLLARGSFDGLTFGTMTGKRGWMQDLWESADDSAENAVASMNNYEEMAAALSADPAAAREFIRRKKEEAIKRTAEARTVKAMEGMRAYGTKHASLTFNRQKLENAQRLADQAAERIRRLPDDAPESRREVLEQSLMRAEESITNTTERIQALEQELAANASMLEQDADIPDEAKKLITKDVPFLVDRGGKFYAVGGAFMMRTQAGGMVTMHVLDVDTVKQKVEVRPLLGSGTRRSLDVNDLVQSSGHVVDITPDTMREPLRRYVKQGGVYSFKSISPAKTQEYAEDLQAAMRERKPTRAYIMTADNRAELRESETGVIPGEGERYLMNTQEDLQRFVQQYPDKDLSEERDIIPFQTTLRRFPRSDRPYDYEYRNVAHIPDDDDFVVKAPPPGLTLYLAPDWAAFIKAVEQDTLFDLIPEKRHVRRKRGTHVQTFHVRKDKDPAQDAPKRVSEEERITRSAEGLKKIKDAERAAYSAWHKEREATPARTFEPQEETLEGVMIQRVPGSQYAAFPATGKRNAKVWQTFNVETREPGPQLKRSELRAWLIKRAQAEYEDAPEMLAKAAHTLSKRCKWHGLDISIETDKGETRSGTDPDGNTWKTTMTYPYGYLRRTRGVDGDHLDCYLGPDEDAAYVYVIHQLDPTTGKYDEDKVMLNFSSEDAAKRAFLKHYDTPDFYYGGMTKIHAAEFAQLVRDGKAKGKIVMGEPSKKAGKLELNTLLDILKDGPKAVKLRHYQNGGIT